MITANKKLNCTITVTISDTDIQQLHINLGRLLKVAYLDKINEMKSYTYLFQCFYEAYCILYK